MNLLLRFVWLLCRYRFRPRCERLGPCTTELIVLPSDLDPLLHVNNGVYLSMLDLARMDLMLRSGMAGPLRQRGWYAVVAAETIRFRRSLLLFQRFRVVTRVAGWDALAFLLEQTFWRGNEVVAEAVVRARFLSRNGDLVGTADVLGLFSVTDPPPPLPDWIAAWNAQNASVGSPNYLQQRTPKL